MRICKCVILLLILFSGIILSQNSWEFTGGPYRGAAEVMVTNSSGHVFAGTPTGVYRSTDNGDTWTHATQSIGIIDVRVLAIKSNTIVFAGTIDGKVYRSLNNGNSWTYVSQGLPAMIITSLVCNNNGDVFVGIDSAGVFRSTNDGDAWVQINQGLVNTEIKALAVKSNGELYVGTYRGLFQSLNNGDNWTEVSLDTTTYEINNKNGIIIRNDSLLYVTTNNCYLFKSTDGGNSWKNLSMVLHIRPSTGDTVYIPDNYLIPPFAIDTNGFFLRGILAWEVLCRETDKGENSTVILFDKPLQTTGFISQYEYPSDDSLIIGYVKSVCFNSNGAMFVGTTKGGIIRFLANDSKWTIVNSNLARPSIVSMVSNSNGRVYTMTEKGVWRSSQTGNNWTRVNPCLINSHKSGMAIHPQGDIYVADFCLYRSTDEGEHWDTCNHDYSTYPMNMVVAASPSGNIYSGNYFSPLYKSTDNGYNWTPLYNNSHAVACSVIAVNSNGHIFINYYDMDYSLLRSTDNGVSWNTCGQGVVEDGFTYLAFKNNQIGFAASYNNGLYRSTDNGDTWEIKNNGLPLSYWYKYYNPIVGRDVPYFGPPQIETIAFNSIGHVFVGYDNGVYRSTDNGDTWAEFNQGLPPGVTINALAIDSSGYLYAGTSYGGVFKTSQNTVSVGEQLQNIPTKFSLEQNYPNPFNPSTILSYQLSVTSNVSVKIFDILGREIATLVNVVEGAGPHTVTWNAQVATGVYFYRLDATSVKDPSKRFVEAKKMLLLR